MKACDLVGYWFSQVSQNIDDNIAAHKLSPRHVDLERTFNNCRNAFPVKDKIELYTPTNMIPAMAGTFAKTRKDRPCPVHGVVHNDVILINYWYLELWPDWTSTECMAHEYAHAIVADLYPRDPRDEILERLEMAVFGDHGPRWMIAMSALGYPNAKPGHDKDALKAANAMFLHGALG